MGTVSNPSRQLLPLLPVALEVHGAMVLLAIRSLCKSKLVAGLAECYGSTDHFPREK